jgi:DNA polymerase III subunit epsilon
VDAGLHRDRLVALLRAVAKTQRLSALAAVPELVAARPSPRGGWEIVVLRHGRMAAAGHSPAGGAVRADVEALHATAEVVGPGPGPAPCASAEEMGVLLRWLGTPGVRLVSLDGVWASAAPGAAVHLRWLGVGAEDAERADPFGDRRGLRPQHRPARGEAVAG